MNGGHTTSMPESVSSWPSCTVFAGINIDASNDAYGSMYLHRLPDSNIALIRKSSQKKIMLPILPISIIAGTSYSFQGG